MYNLIQLVVDLDHHVRDAIDRAEDIVSVDVSLLVLFLSLLRVCKTPRFGGKCVEHAARWIRQTRQCVLSLWR